MSRAACKEQLCAYIVRAELDAFEAFKGQGLVRQKQMEQMAMVLDQAASAMSEVNWAVVEGQASA